MKKTLFTVNMYYMSGGRTINMQSATLMKPKDPEAALEALSVAYRRLSGKGWAAFQEEAELKLIHWEEEDMYTWSMQTEDEEVSIDLNRWAYRDGYLPIFNGRTQL